MERNAIIKTNFVRVFSVEKNAEKFAKENKGKVVVRYEWDDMRCKIVKQYVVKY